MCIPDPISCSLAQLCSNVGRQAIALSGRRPTFFDPLGEVCTVIDLTTLQQLDR